MSAVLRQTVDAHGVILTYAPEVRGRHHVEQRRQPSDRLRCSILRAQRELGDMRLMLECISDVLSDVAIDRFWFALRTVEGTLSLAREEIAQRVTP